MSTQFTSRNNVTFDASGGALLEAWAVGSATLAPSAGLLSRSVFDGNFTVNATIQDFRVVQSGYSCLVSLFLAPASYDLADYLSWPASDALSSQQHGWARIKTYATIDYTWGSIYSALTDSSQQFGANGRMNETSLLSLSRRGNQLSGLMRVGSGPVVSIPTATVATGPVRLGIQALYGYNYSLTVSSISISYDLQTLADRPPPSPPAPPPSPPPPSPPVCAATPATDVVYPGGYKPKGVGGGGAMSSFSISPYSSLWLVGTDMGSLYRSLDAGRTWQPVNHTQMIMTSDMGFAPPVGFSSDGQTLFFAPCWDPATSGNPCVAKRSTDGGATWQIMDVNSGGKTVFNMGGLPPNNQRPIRYWTCSSKQAELCYAATTGGLDRTANKGLTWSFVNHSALAADVRGSFLDSSATPAVMTHATSAGIYRWTDGQLDTLTTVLSGGVRWFAGGRDASGTTLAYVDLNSTFCAEMMTNLGADKRNDTLNTCGRLWVSSDGGATFTPTQHYTTKVLMAENNGRVVYSHGSRSWDRAYGLRIFKTTVSDDGSAITTTKVFDMLNVDAGYALWPADKMEYSAIGLDVGYWDGGYYLVTVNQLDANQLGGSENFFLHVTRDGGAHWEAPFTRYRDCGARGGMKRWSSTGLEPTNFYTVAVHPTNPKFVYGGAADLKGVASDDGGDTWRVLDPQRMAVQNSVYGFAFDPAAPYRVFIASAKWHDFPSAWYGGPLAGNGGIFVSDDVGRTFWRVGLPSTTACTGGCANDMVNDFLAVAYDSAGGYLYAGGHINGIARIRWRVDQAWELINFNLLGDDLWQNETIIPQISVDPDNGDVYCLMTGIRAFGSQRHMGNQARTGIYRMPRGGSSWTLLRGQVAMPAAFAPTKPWQYPIGFAVDWSSGTPGSRTTLFLVDLISNFQPSGACGVWKTADGGATWALKQQSDWARTVLIDTAHSGRVYSSGVRATSNWGFSQLGDWGYGGFMYSDDGGETWRADASNPFQDSMNSVALDPVDPCKLWYATGAGGVLHGPAPPGLPGC